MNKACQSAFLRRLAAFAAVLVVLIFLEGNRLTTDAKQGSAVVLTYPNVMNPDLNEKVNSNTHAADQLQLITGQDNTQGADGSDLNMEQHELLDCLYFDRDDFAKHMSLANQFPLETLSAGIVPHHLLAGDLIASFFLTAQKAENEIETIVVIGPNHSLGAGGIYVADFGWNTPFGVTECDGDTVDIIIHKSSLSAVIDNELLQQDHAVSSLVPYIKYYLPDAKVVSILLSRRVSREQEKILAELLYHLSQEKSILVVGSVDFSHGLPPGEAMRRDEETIGSVFDRAYDVLKNMPNENLDSPETLNVLLRFMELHSSDLPELLCHRSAFDYLRNSEIKDCTTYFVFGKT